MIDSEYSDALSSDDESASQAVSGGVKKCLAMKPLHNASQKSKANSLRAQINKCKTTTSKARNSTRIDNKKMFEDYVHDLSSDFFNLSKKFDTVCDCISNIFDRLDEVEKRIDSFVRRSEEQHTQTAETFSSIAARPPDNDRLNKLEYVASEEERKKRQLEVTLTHPNIDPNTSDLTTHVKTFLLETVKMENREIDVNFQVRKVGRENTVLVTFSDRRFKRFIFAAKKRLRTSHPDDSINFFINDNLTSFNYNLLKKLKMEKKRRTESLLPSFDSLYVFEGKVYVRISQVNSSMPATCISNEKLLQQFLTSLPVESSPPPPTSS